jgi:hypothetical protein
MQASVSGSSAAVARYLRRERPCSNSPRADFTGDGTLIARVAGIQNTNAYAKAGVMFRASAAPDAAFAHVFVGPTTIGF